MALREILNLVWINICGNKSKVLLTSLGIIVGAATIVIVIAIGLGGQKDVQEQFKNLNAGTITIADNSGNASGGGAAMGGMMQGGFSGEQNIRRNGKQSRRRISGRYDSWFSRYDGRRCAANQENNIHRNRC